MNFRIFGILLLLLGLVILGIVNYINNDKRQIPLVFSSKTMLNALWNSYKDELLEDGTLRTLDKTRNNVTTSEGESYTLLRAVWMDDKEIFDQSWQWTKDNLQREDKLLSWLFGERPNKTYGIIDEQGGINSASDADVDTALALLMASKRWGDDKYRFDAIPLIQSIWEVEVVTVNNKPYLAANNLEKAGTGDVLINPSYLAPYAYKIFAEVDPNHDWTALVDSSYELINASIAQDLDKNTSANLPPDWVTLNRQTGALTKPQNPNLTTNYSYDALRLPWRLALDWAWFNDQRALSTLSRMNFLTQEWITKQKINSTYSHDGETLSIYENPSMYGGSLGYFKVADTANLDSVFEHKLKSLYNNDNFSWKEPLTYYDDNWAWFGIALYYNELPNLYKD